MQNHILHIWGFKPKVIDRLLGYFEPCGFFFQQLPTGFDGLVQFVENGGGIVLIPPQDDDGRKRISDIFSHSAVVVFEQCDTCERAQVANIVGSFVHLLLPGEWIGAGLEAAFPIAARLVENEQQKARRGFLSPESADKLAPLLTLATSYRTTDFASEDEFFASVAQFLCQRLSFARVMIFTNDRGKLRLRSLCWPGNSEKRLSKALKENPPLLTEAAPELELFSMARALPVNPQYNSLFAPEISKILGGGEIGLAPLFSSMAGLSDFIGVIAADQGGKGGSIMSEGDLTLLETAAALIGTMLNNYWLFRKLESKAAELEGKLHELTVLNEMVRILNSPDGPDDMAEAMLGAMAQAVGADFGFIFLLDEQANKLRLLCRYNLKLKQIENWEAVDLTNVENVVMGVAAISKDPENAKKFLGKALPEYAGAFLLRELYSRQELAGVWGLGRNKGGAPFNEQEQKLAEMADEQMGIAVNSLRLTHLASIDDLTRLNTRRHFMDVLEHELRIARYLNYSVGIIMLDADHFKNVNDTLGHQAGDEVLRELGRVMRESTRSTDTCARIGGEEFAVLLPRADQAQALRLAEKMRKTMAKTVVKTSAGDVSVTISLGTAIINPGDDLNLDQVMRRADVAMYRSKTDGRNRTTLWTPDMAGE